MEIKTEHEIIYENDCYIKDKKWVSVESLKELILELYNKTGDLNVMLTLDVLDHELEE